MASNVMQTPTRVAKAATPDDSASAVETEPRDEALIIPDTITEDTITGDSLLAGDSLGKDTVILDSLHQAILARNKAIDDSLHADSINRTKSGTIDMPVNYEAKDSIVYFADIKRAFL